jgi:hypothetical protein
MSKAENRAAAKAWHEYREQQRLEANRAADIVADVDELRHLRDYPILERRAFGTEANKLRSTTED